MTSKILVAVDSSKIAQELVPFGLALSRRLGCSSDFIHVLPPIDPWLGYKAWLPQEAIKSAEEEARGKLTRLITRADPASRPSIHIAQGSASEKIIEKVKEGGYDLLVVGHKGDNPLVEIVVGSTASSVARYAPCSVLIYRPGLDIF